MKLSPHDQGAFPCAFPPSTESPALPGSLQSGFSPLKPPIPRRSTSSGRCFRSLAAQFVSWPAACATCPAIPRRHDPFPVIRSLLQEKGFRTLINNTRSLKQVSFTPIVGLPTMPREVNHSLFQDSDLSSPRVIPPVRSSSHFIYRWGCRINCSIQHRLPAHSFTVFRLF